MMRMNSHSVQRQRNVENCSAMCGQKSRLLFRNDNASGCEEARRTWAIRDWRICFTYAQLIVTMRLEIRCSHDFVTLVHWNERCLFRWSIYRNASIPEKIIRLLMMKKGSHSISFNCQSIFFNYNFFFSLCVSELNISCCGAFAFTFCRRKTMNLHSCFVRKVMKKIFLEPESDEHRHLERMKNFIHFEITTATAETSGAPAKWTKSHTYQAFWLTNWLTVADERITHIWIKYHFMLLFLFPFFFIFDVGVVSECKKKWFDVVSVCSPCASHSKYVTQMRKIKSERIKK